LPQKEKILPSLAPRKKVFNSLKNQRRKAHFVGSNNIKKKQGLLFDQSKSSCLANYRFREMDEFRNFNYAANFRLKNEQKKTNFLSAAMLLNLSKYQKTSFIEMLEVLFK